MRFMFLLMFGLTFTMAVSAQNTEVKPFPSGIYESGGPLRNPNEIITGQTVGIDGQDGILLRVAWNLCGDDIDCLIDTIIANLDDAYAQGFQVALAVSDGHNIPSSIKSACNLFTEGTFRGEPISFCLPWDEAYLSAKHDFLSQLGEAIDDHPALASIYFTGACSTNGFEGHCRVDENAFVEAGYTSEILAEVYVDVMNGYLSAFPTTPIVFEVHTLFDDAYVWQTVWDNVRDSEQVGVAAWWCSERLSVDGRDTEPVWSIVQDAASHTFAVCQTVGNFSEQPFRFSSIPLGLDYGEESNPDTWNSDLAFNQTFDWIEGIAVHAEQDQTIIPFSVVEVWTRDLRNVDFQDRLQRFGF